MKLNKVSLYTKNNVQSYKDTKYENYTSVPKKFTDTKKGVVRGRSRCSCSGGIPGAADSRMSIQLGVLIAPGWC